ncbi:MAG: M3 family peptidase, partial [Alphaproteobacteria bacterium]
MNPLLEISPLPNHAPPFDKIANEHYMPAVEEGIKQARANIEAIKNNAAAPDFDNTIAALESASELLGQATGIFYNQLACMGGDDLQELAEKIGPVGSNFSTDVIQDEKLFARVKAVHDRMEKLTLTPEQKTLLDDTYKSFVRGGALLNEDKKKRLREIDEQLSVLSPIIMNNVVKSAESFEMIIEDKKDLSGLPDMAVTAAAHEAEERGHKGKY